MRVADTPTIERPKAIAERSAPSQSRSRVSDRFRSLGDIALISLYGLVIVACAAMSLSKSENFSAEEKRELVTMPALHRKTITAFPRQFEAYASDHMGFRRFFVAVRNLLKYELWGVSGSSQVLLGKQDWLYYLGDGNGPVNRHERLFTAADLTGWKSSLEERTAWCTGHGAKYLFVVAPDKPTIYPEYLPSGQAPVHSESRLDQLTSCLTGDPKVSFLNLALPLLQAKKAGGDLLYLKTDSHWNQRGALVAYQAIYRELQVLCPTLSAVPGLKVAFSSAVCSKGDLVSLLGITGRKNEMVPEGHVERNSVRSDLKVLVVHDSFGETLKPYLTQHFKNVVFIHEDDLTLPKAAILDAKPDIVLQEAVERHVAQLPLVDTGSWVAQHIKPNAGTTGAFLMVMPNVAGMDVTALKKSGLFEQTGVQPTSCRQWTPTGDVVHFDRRSVRYPDWYLLMTGQDQGYKFADDESAAQYGRIEKFVRTSGEYQLSAEMPLREGSTLQLYKRAVR